MILTSRQGVPFSARATNQKGIGGLHRAVFFTRTWIDGLRRQTEAATGSTKLDYACDLWPMLKKEMCFVFDNTRSGASSMDPAQYEPSEASERAIAEIFSPLGAERFTDENAFHDAVRRHTESDLGHAVAGNVQDPVKAATDVLRDVRDYVRYAVDYGGLTEESHRHFLNEVIPVMYRVSAGAPKERNIELLALIDAGIATFGPGPNPDVSFDATHARFALRSARLDRPVEHYADVLIRARIDCSVYPEKQDAPLIRNMLRRGTLRPYMNGGFHPGGNRRRYFAERNQRHRAGSEQSVGLGDTRRRRELLHLRAAARPCELALYPILRPLCPEHVCAARCASRTAIGRDHRVQTAIIASERHSTRPCSVLLLGRLTRDMRPREARAIRAATVTLQSTGKRNYMTTTLLEKRPPPSAVFSELQTTSTHRMRRRPREES